MMVLSEKYRILEQIGRSSKRKFGDLFIANDKVSERKVLVKALRMDNASNLAIERLRNEIDFSFNSEGLPEILDHFESENELIIVRNYVDGVPLGEFWKTIKRRQRIQFLVKFIEKLIPLFEELALQKVVHCDIKSGNILISGNSDSFDVHLIDFGLAINTENPEKRNIIFPLGFAAPELLMNQLDLVDQTTDIYALGILFWQLFTGEIPLTHPNPSIFTNLQLNYPLPDHSSLPKHLYPVLQQMTVKFSFPVPPNQIEPEVMRRHLREAMKNRFQHLSEIHKVLSELSKKRRFWFYQPMSFL